MKYQFLLSGWGDSCSCTCFCQARFLAEGEDATPIADKSRKSPEVVDKNQGSQRIKSDAETVVLMELENIFFPSNYMTTISQNFSSKCVLNESYVCNTYVMTALKIYPRVHTIWRRTTRNRDYYIFLQSVCRFQFDLKEYESMGNGEGQSTVYLFQQ